MAEHICRDCKFWLGPRAAGNGECAAILPDNLKDDKTAFIVTFSATPGWLYTMPTFGCTLWEAK